MCCRCAHEAGIAVAMTDANRDSGRVSEPDHVAAEVVDMAVEYVEGSELSYNSQEVLPVANRPMPVWAAQDFRTERQKFGVIRGRLVRMNQKIHLKSLTINVPQ